MRTPSCFPWRRRSVALQPPDRSQTRLLEGDAPSSLGLGDFRQEVSVLALVVSLTLAAVAGRAADVDIPRVIPSKVRYEPHEKAVAEIRLRNNSTQEQRGVLIVTEWWDLDQQRKLHEKDLALPASQAQSVTINWEAGEIPYGRALKAEFKQDGKVVASRQEFFSVADNWMRVAICAPDAKDIVLAEKKCLTPEDLTLDPFFCYGNTSMAFCWGETQFGGQNPEKDVWFNNRAGWQQRRKDLLEKIGKNKSLGRTGTAYVDFSMGGPKGFEIARQHPEYVLRTEDGAFKHMLPIAPWDLRRDATAKTSPANYWNEMVVDLCWTEVVEYGARNLRDSIRNFGWDGFFFDGNWAIYPGYSWDGKPVTHGQNADELSARNVRIFTKIVREEFPKAVFWANGMSSDKGSFKSDEEFLKSGYGNNGGPALMAELLGDPRNGALVEIQGSFLFAPNRPDHHYRTFYEILLNCRRDVVDRKWGQARNEATLHIGYLWNMDFIAHAKMKEEDFLKSRNLWVQSNHILALLTANRAHPHLTSGSAFRPFLQFLTRYSAFIWGDGIETVKDATKWIKIDCNREIWWEEVVYQRTGKQYTDYLINLITGPDDEAIEAKLLPDPALVEDGQLTLTLKSEAKEVKAWALKPYDAGAAVQEPVEQTVSPKLAGTSCQIQIPPFRYYSLVVVRVPNK